MLTSNVFPMSLFDHLMAAREACLQSLSIDCRRTLSAVCRKFRHVWFIYTGKFTLASSCAPLRIIIWFTANPVSFRVLIVPYRKWNGRSGQYTYHGSKYTPCWREGPVTGFDYPWDATLCIYVASREADSYLYSYAIWHRRRNFINFNHVIITLPKVSTVVSIKSNNTILIFLILSL